MFVSQSITIVLCIMHVQGSIINKRSLAPQISPTFPSIVTPTDVATSYNPGPYKKVDTLSDTRLTGFPETWITLDPNHKEVVDMYNKIDWSKVPDAPVRKQTPEGSWNLDPNHTSDPYCWWTFSNCITPKVSYLPNDIYTCPNSGDWGLNYDDGPFNKYYDANANEQNPYAEPALYNFLANNGLHSTLFFIGSNVVNYPAAARLALGNGHQICVHTWSHSPMTTLSNSQIVAELYWTLKAIKVATGITPKCWRPPQGDVDDRVRAIAWQMGMRTVLWDLDSEDWALPSPNGGTVSVESVNGYFKSWIEHYKSGADQKGHVVLEHELSKSTISMTMNWLPEIQKVFNVIPVLTCNGITQPYWEDKFIYPLETNQKVTTTTSTKKSNTVITTSSEKSTHTSTPNKSTKASNSKKTASHSSIEEVEEEALDKIEVFPAYIKNTPKRKSVSSAQTKHRLAKNHSSKTKIKHCTKGVSGTREGTGETGYCCTSSDDCIETCRKGVCGF